MKPQDDVKPDVGQSGSTVGLERCPFCGGTATLHTDGLTVIVCNGCGIYFSNGKRSMRLLSERWNMRSNEQN